jgi:hypothetical protein
MKKHIIISLICLSFFTLTPVLASCEYYSNSNCSNCLNANNSNCQNFVNQNCQSSFSNYSFITQDNRICYSANSADQYGIHYFCGVLANNKNENYCGCNNNSCNATNGCFRINYVDQNNGFYYCVNPSTLENNNNMQTCKSSGREDGKQFRNNGNTYIKVENGGIVYVNGSQVEKKEAQRSYQNFVSRGIGVYTRDLRKIPIGIIHMFGDDSDKDGLPDDFERAIGTDPYNFNTDKDRYSDKTEVVSGFNPNGTGRMSFDQKIINKFRGKFLIQVEQSGELWYVNPKDGKRYFIGNEYDAMEIIKAFKL